MNALITMIAVALLVLLQAAHGAPSTSCPNLRLVQELCPVDCDCTCPIPRRADVYVECSHRVKLSIPPRFPPNTVHLVLKGNPLQSLDFRNKDLDSVRTLDLSYCSLTTLGKDPFQPMKNLHTVYLNDNNLSEMTLRALLLDMKSLHHVHFHLEGNRFDCHSLKTLYSNKRISCGSTTARPVTSTTTTTRPVTSTTTTTERNGSHVDEISPMTMTEETVMTTAIVEQSSTTTELRPVQDQVYKSVLLIVVPLVIFVLVCLGYLLYRVKAGQGLNSVAGELNQAMAEDVKDLTQSRDPLLDKSNDIPGTVAS